MDSNESTTRLKKNTGRRARKGYAKDAKEDKENSK